MKVLDLFSGIGGFSLGLERAGFKTVAFCEIDPFCRKVLKKHWPDVPIYEDVRNVTAECLAADGIGPIHVVTGGFPCQDLSIAGKQAGLEGERSGLWSELCRIICELRPRYALMENVANLLAGERGAWMGRVLADLAEIGYDAEWHCIPASRVGLPIIRDRVWIIAYPNCIGFQRGEIIPPVAGITEQLQRLLPPRTRTEISQYFADRGSDGIPDRVDRLHAIGNSVVPQIPELIGRAIMEAER